MFESAAIRKKLTFVIAAMILDMLDGRAARMLGADSRFGAQLDSLADLVSFGVAPAITLYVWGLDQARSFGWIAALLLGVCAALRLARFNVSLGAAAEKPAFAGSVRGSGSAAFAASAEGRAIESNAARNSAAPDGSGQTIMVPPCGRRFGCSVGRRWIAKL